MNFREATDALCESVTHADLADAVDRSEQAVRQARLPADAKGYRSPPPGWEAAVAKLARKRAQRLEQLAKKLEGRP